MEFSMPGYVLSCLIISCFSFSEGDNVYGNELHHHKQKGQDLRHRQVIDPDFIANRPDSPYKIAKRSTTTNLVDIAMFSDSSAPGKQFSVYVDSTMTRLIVEVKVDRSNPVIIVTKPSGPGPFPKLNGTASTGTVTATIDVAITAADYGIWKLTKLDANTWNVKVQGESPLDFSYQFLEGTMFKMPVTGDPIQGKDYTTVITVPQYATIQTIDLILEFVTDNSNPSKMHPPSDQGGGKYQVASIKMLDKDFMIGIQGRDKSGHFFRRITVIKPIAMILYVPSFAGVKLYENTNLDIPFSVVNKLSTDHDIDVGIKDTQGFAQAPKFISATLKPDQNFTGKFVIKGGLLGVTTSVTITAKPYLGRGQVSHGPSEVRLFTVENNQTTTTSTSTTTTSTVTSTSTTSVTSKPTTPSSTASSSVSSSVSTIKSTAKATSSSTSFSSHASSQVTSNTQPVISSSLVTSAASIASSLSSSVSVGSKTTTASKPSITGSTISSAVQSIQSTAAVSTNKPIVSSGAGATAAVATSLQSSTVSVSALTGGKVSTTHASTSAKSVSASGGTSSNGASTIKSTSATSGKVSTGPLHVKSTTQQAAVSALSSSKATGQTTTSASDGDNEETFSKGEIFGAAVVSGVSAGVLIGVAALVTMGLVFKHAINKGKVTPDKKKQRMFSEQNDLAWT